METWYRLSGSQFEAWVTLTTLAKSDSKVLELQTSLFPIKICLSFPPFHHQMKHHQLLTSLPQPIVHLNPYCVSSMRQHVFCIFVLIRIFFLITFSCFVVLIKMSNFYMLKSFIYWSCVLCKLANLSYL